MRKAFVVALSICLAYGWAALSADSCFAKEETRQIAWQDSYGQAMDLAKEGQKMLFIYFYDPANPGLDELDRWASSSADFADLAQELVFCKVSIDQDVISQGKSFKLIEHQAFHEMLDRPGIAMIDCVDPEAETYGHVVSVYPVTTSRVITDRALNSLVRLPRGTITQRSLVLAVALHRDRPRSIRGRWNPVLAEETQSHSHHQASINNQGHHNWGHRFQRIMGRLGNGMLAREVVAESWPGQSLMDAAEECVSSWRQSPGHWNAVSSEHPVYAYDMKRGSNGVWYATGIFAN